MTVLDADGKPVPQPRSPGVEMPPNKAIAAAGSAGIGSVIVGLALFYFAHDTPPEVVGMWTALVNTLIGFGATYLVPHGAVQSGG